MTVLSYSEMAFTSSKRTDGTNNRPEFRLEGGQIQKVRKIKAASVIIPVTYYNVNSSNNTFSFEESAGGGSVDSTLTIGNYNDTTFATELKTQMEADSVNGYTYTVTVSAATFKMTISTAANFEVDVSTSSVLTGFSTATVAATSATGDLLVNLSGPNQLYLRSNIATRISTSSVVKNDKIFNNVLATIPINVNTFEYVYKSFDTTQYFDADIDIQDLEFYFTDDDDTQIDFNGVPFSLTIQLFRETRDSR